MSDQGGGGGSMFCTLPRNSEVMGSISPAGSNLTKTCCFKIAHVFRINRGKNVIKKGFCSELLKSYGANT